MKPLNIWVLQTGEPLHSDSGNPRPMRAMNLVDALNSAGHKVVVWSSSFYHQEKRHRSRAYQKIVCSDKLEIRLIMSPGYDRNIGFGRLFDHWVLGWNLNRLLQSETQRPDVAFVGYPPIECAAVMLRWLTRRSIPSIVDVKDQWPSMFLEAMPLIARPFGRLALAPYFSLGRRALRDATGFASMSKGYLNWMATFAGRALDKSDIVVPLTTPEVSISRQELAAAVAWWRQKGVLLENRRRVCFAGTFNSVFNFRDIRDAAAAMNNAGIECQFVMCGSGSCEYEVREMMRGLDNVVFPGWIDQPQLLALARGCIASLMPYKNIESFTPSIPNKVIDALANGLPIVTSLTGEVQTMIEAEEVGFLYNGAQGRDCCSAIMTLLSDADLQAAMAARARSLYEQRFAFDKVYGALVSHLELLAHDGL
jgi:glycosyltransferase involved in cell wall biosynthesis